MKIILNNDKGSEEKETLNNTYPDFKKQPWASPLSLKTGCPASWRFFGEICKFPWRSKPEKQAHGSIGCGIWRRPVGKRDRLARGSGLTLLPLLPYYHYYHSSGPSPPQVCRQLPFTGHSPGAVHGLSVLSPCTLSRGCYTGSLVSLAVEGRHRIYSISVFWCPTS